MGCQALLQGNLPDRDRTHVSYISCIGRQVLYHWCHLGRPQVSSESDSHSVVRPHGLYSPWNSPGQNTGVGSLSLLQGIFPTQDRTQVSCIVARFFYQLSHKGHPRILEWVAYPFSRGSSQPRNQTRVSCIAGGFFTFFFTGKKM